MSVLDFVHVGSAFAMRSFGRLGSSLSSFGLARVGSSLSVLDFVHVGSGLALRSVIRVGSAVSAFGDARMGSSAAVLDFVHVGSSLALRSFGRVGSSLAVLDFVHLLPNKFSYPTTSTMAFVKAGYAVDFVTVEASPREGKSKVRPVRDGVRFLVIIGKMVMLFEPMRVFMPAALVLLLMAVASFVFTVVDESRLHIPNSAVFLAVSAVIVFLIGMVAAQVADLRVSLGSRRR